MPETSHNMSQMKDSLVKWDQRTGKKKEYNIL